MFDKKYVIVVAMVTVLRTKIKYVHHMEERLFFWSSVVFSATTFNNVLSIVTEFVKIFLFCLFWHKTEQSISLSSLRIPVAIATADK